MNIEKAKQVIKKYWWIILIVVFIIIIILVLINENIEKRKEKEKADNKQKTNWQETEEQKNIREGRKPPMTSKELAAADKALALGISIDDPQNDYVKMPGGIRPDGRPDNTNPWPLPFTDLKKAQVGADQTYIYVKYQFYGIIPVKMVTVGDDFLSGSGVNFGVNKYYNNNLKKEQEGALMQTAICYATRTKEQLRLDSTSEFYNPPKLGTSTFGEANAEVKNKDGEDTYGIATSEGKVYGGAGYDYILAAFPLANLGLKYGDTIIFEISAESGSRVYHHQSVDALLDYGHSKSGEYITWKIGSNTYTSKIPNY